MQHLSDTSGKTHPTAMGRVFGIYKTWFENYHMFSLAPYLCILLDCNLMVFFGRLKMTFQS